MEHWVVFIIKTNADVGDGERVQNYNKPVHVTKSVIKKGQPYIAKDGLNWLSFTTNLHCNLYNIILILILTNSYKTMLARINHTKVQMII